MREADAVEALDRDPWVAERTGQYTFVPQDHEYRLVEVMASNGMTVAQMRLAFINPRTGKPIDARTFKDAFRAELKTELVHINARVQTALYQNTQGYGSAAVNACKFWLERKAGWIETTRHEHSPGADMATVLRRMAEKRGEVIDGEFEQIGEDDAD